MTIRRSSIHTVASAGLMVLGSMSAVVACERDDEQAERARMRLELELLRARLQVVESELDAKRTPQPLVVTEAVAIDVPRAHAGELESTQLLLVATSAGVTLNGKAIDAAELDAKLRELASTQPDTSLVVRAEQGVSHEHVVALLDRAKAAGIRRFSLAGPADEPTPPAAAK